MTITEQFGWLKVSDTEDINVEIEYDTKDKKVIEIVHLWLRTKTETETHIETSYTHPEITDELEAKFYDVIMDAIEEKEHEPHT